MKKSGEIYKLQSKTIQPQEYPISETKLRATWIHTFDKDKKGLDFLPNIYTCSSCGYRNFVEQFNFCPNCGAAMINTIHREEEENGEDYVF